MGRGRGKGKRLTAASHDDPGSGGEEPLPAYKRRGRPQKSMKDDIDDEEAEKNEEDDVEDTKSNNSVKDSKGTNTDNGRKRRRNLHFKENSELAAEEIAKSNTEVPTKSNCFRTNGSRRKSKPHRAAEAGVEYK